MEKFQKYTSKLIKKSQNREGHKFTKKWPEIIWNDVQLHS